MSTNVYGEKRWYPELPEYLRAQFNAVPASGGFYRPCDVTLHDGSVVERVFVGPADKYIAGWGVWPEEDDGKRSIDIFAIASIRDSRSRLRAKFANQLYRAGESGMGYLIFTVCFKDGSSMATCTGNAVDFIRYPEGQSPETVRKVIPHLGRDDPSLSKGPDYHWSLFLE